MDCRALAPATVRSPNPKPTLGLSYETIRRRVLKFGPVVALGSLDAAPVT